MNVVIPWKQGIQKKDTFQSLLNDVQIMPSYLLISFQLPGKISQYPNYNNNQEH